MLTYFLERAIEMLTVADMGEGGVKNGPKSADVLYGRPLMAMVIQGVEFLISRISSPLDKHSWK